MQRLKLFGKRSLKSLVAPFSRPLTGLRRNYVSANNAAGVVRVLAYHRVVADIAQAERESIYGLVVSTETFARQLETLREDYEVLTLEQALKVLRGEWKVGRAAAVITFDDGYRDVYEHAWPVLKRMGLPATVFVPTAFIGGTRLLDHDRLYWMIHTAHERGIDLHAPLEEAGLSPERAAWLCKSRQALRVLEALNYQPVAVREPILQSLAAALGEVQYPAHYQPMTWEMVREMADAGIGFGAHSDRHLILTLESEIAVEREIRRSKRVLEEHLNRPVQHFAYPNGYYNNAIKAMVARAGFVSAVTTERRLAEQGDDLLALGRISLCEESTRGITGKYSAAIARLRLAA